MRVNSLKRLFSRVTLLFLVVVVATGCSRERPILQVDNRPIPQLAQPLTLEQIEARIIKAGKERRWRMAKIGSGQLQGHLSWRRNSAVVNIQFDRKSYSIRYKSSKNLEAGTAKSDQAFAGQFTIHRRYNREVRRLEIAIDSELTSSGL